MTAKSSSYFNGWDGKSLMREDERTWGFSKPHIIDSLKGPNFELSEKTLNSPEFKKIASFYEEKLKYHNLQAIRSDDMIWNQKAWEMFSQEIIELFYGCPILANHCKGLDHEDTETNSFLKMENIEYRMTLKWVYKKIKPKMEDIKVLAKNLDTYYKTDLFQNTALKAAFLETEISLAEEKAENNRLQNWYTDKIHSKTLERTDRILKSWEVSNNLAGTSRLLKAIRFHNETLQENWCPKESFLKSFFESETVGGFLAKLSENLNFNHFSENPEDKQKFKVILVEYSDVMNELIKIGKNFSEHPNANLIRDLSVKLNNQILIYSLTEWHC